MYETTPGRVIVSIIYGALLGAGIICGVDLWGAYLTHGKDYFVQYDLFKANDIFIVAFLVWVTSISLCGGPVWWWLHRKRLRQLWVAAVAGAIIPFVVTFAISTQLFTGRMSGLSSSSSDGGQKWKDGVLTTFGWQMAFEGALTYGVMGAIIGCLIWRLAYRRSKNPDENS